MSESGESESVASLTDDSDDLRLQLLETIGDHPDGIGIIEGGSGNGGAKYQKNGEDEDQTGSHLSSKILTRTLRSRDLGDETKLDWVQSSEFLQLQ